MTVRGFRDSFRSYTPIWLQNRQDLVAGNLMNAAYRLLYSVIFPLDVAVQTMIEGLKAAWPGVGTPSALAIIALGRGLLRGEAETDDHFAARLVQWLVTWSQDGCFPNEMLARGIQNYLGNTPMVRVVDRSGQWMTVDSAGVATETTAPWNWDGISNPERAGIWSDLWIIIYPVEWAQAPTLATRASSSHALGYGLGHLVQRTAVDAILSLVFLCKDAHTTVRAIIWSYDPTMFVPGGGSNPDGTWGYDSKLSGGPTGTRVPARSASARYWIPSAV